MLKLVETIGWLQFVVGVVAIILAIALAVSGIGGAAVHNPDLLKLASNLLGALVIIVIVSIYWLRDD